MSPAGPISYSTAYMLPHSAEIATNSRWRLKDTPARQTTYEQQSHHLVYHRSSVRIIVSIDIRLGGTKLSTKIGILWTCWLFQKCGKTKCKLQYSRSYTSRLSNFGELKRRWQLRQKEHRYIRYLPPRRSVLGTNEPEVSNMSRSRGPNMSRDRAPRAVLETSGTVFPNTDRTRPANKSVYFFLRDCCESA